MINRNFMSKNIKFITNKKDNKLIGRFYFFKLSKTISLTIFSKLVLSGIQFNFF
jgi:hypothetical protein